MLKGAYLTVGAVFWGVVSFVVAAWLGEILSILWAVLTGGVMVAFVRFIDELGTPDRHGLESSAMAAASTTLAAGLSLFGQPSSTAWAHWVAVPIAAISAWAMDHLLRTGVRHACFICKTAGDQRSMFRCPRCHQHICTQPTCWNARHFRCRYCDEREVVLFPIAEQWWATRLGRRVTKGECASCYKESHEADLRECGQCRWAMCKRCWDFHNGQCSHCSWLIPDMPADLYTFLGPRPASGSRGMARQRGVRG